MKSTLLVIFFSLFLASCGLQSIPQANNEVEAGWAEVQNQYKRRSDLIPNLVETVKGYAGHEKETLEGVISARAKATAITVDPKDLTPEKLQQFQQAQGQLSQALGRLMVVSEKYPDLKANSNFQGLQAQLEGTENRIAIARRRYIDTVKEFNNLVTVFPTSLTNSLIHKFDKKPQFTATETEQKNPEVKF
ncbi:MAG TPA: LemA family protein [Bacteriovoracaceae bacterium]|nr:LemA family protein [Bacteriovoracaceae bacterium]